MASANDVLDLARSQLGTHSPDNRTPYNVEYGLSGPGAAWCQMFVFWCLSHSGVETIRTAWTPSGIAYYEGQGRWTNGTAGIQPGDVIYFDYDNYSGQRTDHVGFVEAVDGGTIQTIEGNVGGGYVKRLWHKADARYIVGYGRPAYDGAPSAGGFIPPAPVTLGSDKVRSIQELLTKCGIDPGPIDGIYGPKTRSAVAEWQRRLAISADGEWGGQTQRSTDQFFEWLASNNTPTPPVAPTPQVDLSGVAAGINAARQQTLRNGSSGDAVFWLQVILNGKIGVGLATDKQFGPKTDAAVRSFQRRSSGLVVDGIVGPQTWASLLG
jgi:peptidoglycan hydrolase-like protein with peptidoglycan-binding domain